MIVDPGYCRVQNEHFLPQHIIVHMHVSAVMTLNKKSLFQKKKYEYIDTSGRQSQEVGGCRSSLYTFPHNQTNCIMMCLLSLHYGGYRAELRHPHFLFLKRGGMGRGSVGFNPGKDCLPPGKQLAGWPGSEVDSLFLVTWFRTWLLHSPCILSLVFSWHFFQKLGLNPSCIWSHSKLCFWLWWEQYSVWAHCELCLPLTYNMSTHFCSSIESTVILKQMLVADKQGMAYSVLILNQNSAISVSY